MKKYLAELLSWVHYPLVMTAVFSLFAWMQHKGLSLILSTYLPVFLAGCVVTWLEFQFPHRAEWRPEPGEVRTDFWFFSVVQMALPPLIGFLFVYALIRPVHALHLPTERLWPHSWPIWVQVVLMILVVDLLRYWLHRAAHENATLWRLHAVHHSVEQLYWFNTVRFHPIEKALQMSLDSLPFLLMGVNAKVLALYYMAYAAQRRIAGIIRARFGNRMPTMAIPCSFGTYCSEPGICRRSGKSKASGWRIAIIRSPF
jgi:sterol desaturase/sphingolipid hydroxylase (fatty acid hydroxylase superfamily)